MITNLRMELFGALMVTVPRRRQTDLHVGELLPLHLGHGGLAGLHGDVSCVHQPRADRALQCLARNVKARSSGRYLLISKYLPQN